MAYIDIYKLYAEDSKIKNEITIAVIKAAIDIFAESDTTPNHENRLKWARDAIKDPGDKVKYFFPYALTNSAIRSGTYQDTDIQSAVTNNVNIFAI